MSLKTWKPTTVAEKKKRKYWTCPESQRSKNLWYSQDSSLNFMSFHGKEPDSLREEKGEYKHVFFLCEPWLLEGIPLPGALKWLCLPNYSCNSLFSARYSWHLDALTIWRVGLSLQNLLVKARRRVLSLMYLVHALLVWAFRNYKKLWNVMELMSVNSNKPKACFS